MTNLQLIVLYFSLAVNCHDVYNYDSKCYNRFIDKINNLNYCEKLIRAEINTDVKIVNKNIYKIEKCVEDHR